MRWRYLAISFFGHAAVFVALFVFVPAARPLTRFDAIPVHIVGATSLPEAQAAPAEAAPERPPLPAEPTPNRPQDQVVKLPKAAKEPAPEAKPQETVLEDDGPVQGAPGLSAGVAVDAANFEFTYYLIALRNRIGQNWSAPAGLAAAGEPVRAVIYFRIERDGTVSDVRVEESSSRSFFDQSAVRAVRISAPLPPLPLAFDGEQLGVHFGFTFEGR